MLDFPSSLYLINAFHGIYSRETTRCLFGANGFNGFPFPENPGIFKIPGFFYCSLFDVQPETRQEIASSVGTPIKRGDQGEDYCLENKKLGASLTILLLTIDRTVSEVSFMRTLPVVRLAILLVIILVGMQQESMAGTDPIEPDKIMFMETNYFDRNNNLLKNPEPLYKDGLELMTKETMKLKDGWKFIMVDMEFSGLDKELLIDLDQVWVTLDNKPIGCSAYGVAYTFFRCGHNVKSEGSLTPQSKTYFYTKLEWKDNIVRLSGLRRNWASFQVLFTVPKTFDLKKFNWYKKALTERRAP